MSQKLLEKVALITGGTSTARRKSKVKSQKSKVLRNAQI